MTTQEKINKIYEVIADKTLSFGCSVRITEVYTRPFTHTTKIVDAEDGVIYETIVDRSFDMDDCSLEVIGHPVMIGDVLDYTHKNILEENTPRRISNKVHMLREHKRKPIEEQNSDCIDFIYLLITNE